MMHRVPNTITQRNKALHAQQRRILSHGFSDAALRSYEESMAAHTQEFYQHLSRSDEIQTKGTAMLDKGWSGPKDMARWCDYLTFDIMLDIIYRSKTDMLGNPKNRPLLDAIATSNIRVGVMIPLHFLKGTRVERYLFPSSILARYQFIGFVRELLSEKKAEKKKTEEGKSVYSILMGARNGEGLSDSAIAAESTNLITAGKLLCLQV